MGEKVTIAAAVSAGVRALIAWRRVTFILSLHIRTTLFFQKSIPSHVTLFLICHLYPTSLRKELLGHLYGETIGFDSGS